MESGEQGAGPPQAHDAPRDAESAAPRSPLPSRSRLLQRTVLAASVILFTGTVYWWLTWPDVGALRGRPPGTTAFIDRSRARTGERVAWIWVPADAVSPHLKRAVVAAEDLEFFSHSGFSTAEIRAALRQAVREGRTRGASTITQQLAKNLWLSPSKNPLRKVKEAILTWQLERKLGKQRILDVYLNVVEFGPGIYGAEAAARHYYGKPASALTEHEAALLAASLPRPTSWNPGSRSEAYERYVAEIEQRMTRATFLWRYFGGMPAPPVDSVAIDTVLIDTLSVDSTRGARTDTARAPARGRG